MQRYLILDYETRSQFNVRDIGAVEYARHSSTRILCASWRFGTRDVLRTELETKITPKSWSPAFDKQVPRELSQSLSDPNVKIVAHNALFEQMITRYVLIKYPLLFPVHFHRMNALPPERWICTAASAAALALPRSLEGSAKAISLNVQKDAEGNRLMKKMARPRKPSKNNPSVWHDGKDDLLRLMQYCNTDVDVETALFLANEDLSESEKRVWLLDQKINSRGFAVDRELIAAALELIKIETESLAAEVKELTGGSLNSTNQTAKLKIWLSIHGVELENLQAKTIVDRLKTGDVVGDEKRLLEIRQELSKTSTAKYEAFEMRSRSDGRLRDHTLYHGASTGRMTSQGAQIHNLPQGRSVADQVGASELIKMRDLELIRMIYGNPMNVFSACLRPVIAASPNCEMFAGDFNAIEVRVLFWMADHSEGLDAFVLNKDQYREMATRIYNKDLADIRDEDEREVGKRAVLGCGFGMGALKFGETCEKYAMPVTEEVAERAVKAYRSVHWPVPKMWRNIERAAISAVKNPGKSFEINHTKWFMKDDYLKCELPSGRRLSYYRPEIKYEMWRNSLDGEKRAVLYHWDVDPLTKQWVFVGTYGGRLVENCVQGCARDFMVEAQLRLEGKCFANLLSVHDELIVEAKEKEFTLKQFETVMSEIPVWGAGCPIKVKGWVGKKYHK